MANDARTSWTRKSFRYIFESKWYKVRADIVELPDNSRITYNVTEHPGATMIVPLMDDSRVVMERIYRYPVDRVLLECPSGGLAGDQPLVAARRELEEETGYRAAKMHKLGSFVSTSGISDEICHIFLATGLSADGIMNREITEQITLELIPLDTLVMAAQDGQIEDAHSTLAILLTEAYLGKR